MHRLSKNRRQLRLCRGASFWHPQDALHLMTYRDGQTVRVTSPVSAVDRKRRTVTTSSGRVYNLRAAPEEDRMAVALLRANAIRVGLLGAIDVSDDAWTELLGHAVGRSLFRSRP